VIAGLARQLLEVVLELPDRGIAEFGRRGFFCGAYVELAQHADGLGRAFVLDVVRKVAHRSPVEIFDRLLPADVAMVDFPEQPLGVLEYSCEFARDIEQHLLLFRNDDIDRSPAKVDLESLRMDLARALRPGRIHARHLAKQFGLAPVVCTQTFEDAVDFAFDFVGREWGFTVHAFDEFEHGGEDSGMFSEDLRALRALFGRGLGDRPKHGLVALLAFEVALESVEQLPEKFDQEAAVAGLHDPGDDVTQLGIRVEDLFERAAPVPMQRGDVGVLGRHPIDSSPIFRFLRVCRELRAKPRPAGRVRANERSRRGPKVPVSRAAIPPG